MKRELRLILGDQLNLNHSWFKKVEPHVTYVMMEVRSEATYVTHHIQKIIAFFLAMRAFHAELKLRGHSVIYLTLDNPENNHSLAENIKRLCKKGSDFSSFAYQLPDEYRVDQELLSLKKDLEIPVVAVDSEHFFTARTELAQLFKGKKTRVMESFYRAMRVKHDVLMTSDGPEGGEWNYDSENRNRYDGKVVPPAPLDFKNGEAAREIVNLLKKAGVKTIGSVDAATFPWPVTRAQALQALNRFVKSCLPYFGKYQDSMAREHSLLFHSLLSFPLNAKILSPREVIDAAIKRYRSSKGAISLPQIEGFVRQILGWREYMRGMYWEQMPSYAERNFFGNSRKLPHYFWDGDTKMNCLRHAIGQSLSLAYAHHIQRLMVTGSFCLMAGIDPDEVDRWYLGIYIDAVEWVELMNTRGMSQWADGGIVATKPYCGSANYMKKMSDYCSGCHYDPTKRIGDDACPLNALYWDFHLRNREKLEKNHRIGMVYRTLDKMSATEKTAVKSQALRILNNIEDL